MIYNIKELAKRTSIEYTALYRFLKSETGSKTQIDPEALVLLNKVLKQELKAVSKKVSDRLAYKGYKEHSQCGFVVTFGLSDNTTKTFHLTALNHNEAKSECIALLDDGLTVVRSIVENIN